ncbi:hypothetical protein ACFX2I_024976 [Malus domestica]
MLKDLIMKLAQERIIKLDLDNVVALNHITITFASSYSTSSPRSLGACSKTMPVKPSEVEGWTQVTSNKPHKKHMPRLQVDQSRRRQKSSCQSPKQQGMVDETLI